MIMIVIFNLFYSESYVSCDSNNYKKKQLTLNLGLSKMPILCRSCTVCHVAFDI